MQIWFEVWSQARFGFTSIMLIWNSRNDSTSTPQEKKTNLYNIFSKGLRVQSLWIMGFLSWGDHQMEVSQNRATTCHQSSRHRWPRLTKPMVTTGESPLPAASQGIPWKSMGMSVDPSRDASSFKETNYTWKKSEKLTTLALACFSEGYRNMRKLLWRWQLPKTNGHNVCGASDHLKQRQANMALFFLWNVHGYIPQPQQNTWLIDSLI